MVRYDGEAFLCESAGKERALQDMEQRLRKKTI